MNIKDISIRWKIVAAVAAGPIILSVILAWLRIVDIRQRAESALVGKSQAIVMMAEAARNEMANKLNNGVLPNLDQLPSDKVLQAVPVITAINVAAANAKENGYRFRVPKIMSRNPKNEPDELEKKILDELRSGGATEKVVVEPGQIRYFRAVKLTQDCLFCHGDPKGAIDPTGGIKEGWRAGEIHGAFEIISSLDATNAAISAAKRGVVLVASLCLIATLAVIWLFLQKNLLKPLTIAREMVGYISEGDLTRTSATDSRDELGQMIRAINQMGCNLNTMVKELVQSSEAISRSSSELSGISGELFEGAENTSSRANSVAVAAEEMSTNMNSVAAAAEQASTNMEGMTRSVEIMKSTIDSISNDTDSARSVTGDAVVQAQSASKRVNQLGQLAREIEKITEAITDISEQTNLLALNATIEAARAGEAGKGFAVVANEIKELAKQTASATNEINQMVSKIQGSTIDTVSDIEQVTKVIENVNETVNGIAHAMNDQMNSTNEIVTNITQGSAGIQEVNMNVAQSSMVSSEIAKNIAAVNDDTQEISTHSKQVAKSAEGLKDVSSRLKESVTKFKI